MFDDRPSPEGEGHSLANPVEGTTQQSLEAPHRATYFLERGVWRARCRVCGYETFDANRQMAASSFRHHIRLTRLDAGSAVAAKHPDGAVKRS
jgi:hypothetical protein